MNLLQNPGSNLALVVVLVVVSTGILVALDAGKLGIGGATDLGTRGRQRSGPGTWAVFQFVLWIVAYPAYLFWRSRYGAKDYLLAGILTASVFVSSVFTLDAAIDRKKQEVIEASERAQRDLQRAIQDLNSQF